MTFRILYPHDGQRIHTRLFAQGKIGGNVVSLTGRLVSLDPPLIVYPTEFRLGAGNSWVLKFNGLSHGQIFRLDIIDQCCNVVASRSNLRVVNRTVDVAGASESDDAKPESDEVMEPSGGPTVAFPQDYEPAPQKFYATGRTDSTVTSSKMTRGSVTRTPVSITGTDPYDIHYKMESGDVGGSGWELEVIDDSGTTTVQEIQIM